MDVGTEEAAVQDGTHFWARWCSRANAWWDPTTGYPTVPTDVSHPSTCRMAEDSLSPINSTQHLGGLSVMERAAQLLPTRISDFLLLIRNITNRHTRCSPAYCERLDPRTGQRFYRFRFPHTRPKTPTMPCVSFASRVKTVFAGRHTIRSTIRGATF